MFARTVLLLAAICIAAPAWAQDTELDLDLDLGAPAGEQQPLAEDVVGNDRQARLDRLFERLATAKTPEDAKRFEATIDQLWGRSGSDTADLLTARAVELVAAEDREGALKLLDAALQAKPDYAEGWNKRATLFFLEGDYASAMNAIRETLRYEPRHYGAWAGLGRILQQTGDERRALDAYRRALAIHPHLEGLKDEADKLSTKLKGEAI